LFSILFGKSEHNAVYAILKKERIVMIIRYDFNARNTPIVKFHIEVADGVARVYVPGVRDTILVPEGTGLDISVEYRGPVTSDATGRVEVTRSNP
jgi:hypothetical protein